LEPLDKAYHQNIAAARHKEHPNTSFAPTQAVQQRQGTSQRVRLLVYSSFSGSLNLVMLQKYPALLTGRVFKININFRAFTATR
jgi:hypothetical protein